MSPFGRYCCKSRKSNNPENLANGDFYRSPPLQRSVGPIRRSVVVFSVKRCGPSRRRMNNAPAVLKKFVRQSKKTFSTLRHQADIECLVFPAEQYVSHTGDADSQASP